RGTREVVATGLLSEEIPFLEVPDRIVDIEVDRRIGRDGQPCGFLGEAVLLAGPLKDGCVLLEETQDPFPLTGPGFDMPELRSDIDGDFPLEDEESGLIEIAFLADDLTILEGPPPDGGVFVPILLEPLQDR